MMNSTRFLKVSVLVSAAIFLWSASCPAEPNPEVRAQAEAMFERQDADKDGKLSESEFPERARGMFSRIDADKDGFVTLDEDVAFRTRAGMAGKSRPGGSGRGLDLDGVTVERDLAYVEEGHERHRLDLYIPEGGKPMPLIVWIHGGGWRNGSKDGGPFQVLLENGFAVASINYRLSGHEIFPAQIHDCKAAIRWLRSKADEYGLDPDRFGVWGSSAGGHLSALVGTSGDVPELEGDLGVTGVSSRVQAVCDWFGPTDFLRMNEQRPEGGGMDHNRPDSPESLLIGGNLQDYPELAKKADPITYVTEDDPEFFIMHGDRDTSVPVGQSYLLRDALEQAGVPHELIVVEGAGHGFREAAQREQVLRFFEETLKNDAAGASANADR